MVRRRAVILIAGLGLAAGGCGSDAPVAVHDNAQPRIFADVVLDERIIAGGSDEDTLLALVGPMFADREGVVVADVHKGTVTRLSRDGHIEWQSSRGGQGPGEFGRVVALQGVEGAIWALDTDNLKVVVLAEDGSVADEQLLSGLTARPTGVLPGERAGEGWYVTASQLEPLVRLGAGARSVGSAALPWDSAAALSSLSSQVVSVADVDRGVLYMAFQLGNGLMRFDGESETGLYRGFVEPVAFTPVVERVDGGSTLREFATAPTFAARSAAVADGRVYILFGGESDDRLQVIDVYDGDTLAYLESIRLPRRASTAAVAFPDIYVTYSDPFPTIARYSVRTPDGR